MKRLLIVMVLTSSLSYGQDLKLFFPEMDRQLVSLTIQNESAEVLASRVENINQIWTIAYPIVCDNISCVPDGSIYCIEELLLMITTNASRNKWNIVKIDAFDLLREFRSIREAYTTYLYPLDYLMHTYDSVLEVEYVVNDLMFGLKYWFEFRDILNALQSNWNTYRSVPDSEILFYNTSIDKELHEDYCLQFESCLESFF